MSSPTSPFRPTTRWLAPVLALLAVAPAAPAAAAAAAPAWRLEPIGASEGVAGLHDLSFDAQGHGLLSWNGALQGRVPALFGGLASRDPAGGWLRPPDLAGVEPLSAQIHLFAQTRALLVAREGGAGGPGRRRLVVADGRSDGGFGTLQTLARFTAGTWSAANASGDAIVAFTKERSPFLSVSERTGGDEPFSRPRDLAVASSAAVAINARGDRVLAWARGTRLAARVRLAGGSWGPTVLFAHLAAPTDPKLSALIARNGRIVVTWGSDRRNCGVAVRGPGGIWRSRRLERSCGPAGIGVRGAHVLPFADSRSTYVAWTGRAGDGRRAVKLARIGPDGPRDVRVLSRQDGAALDDVAAGPRRSLVVTWTAPAPTRRRPFITATFAALRRGDGAFSKGQRLTPSSVAVARGSRAAFHPLTGEPVVAVPYFVGRTVAVGAAIGPPSG